MDFRPVPWRPLQAPKLTGSYRANCKLAGGQRWDTGGIGPEDVVVAHDGAVYCGLEDGRILQLPGGGDRPVAVANTGGRPLGIELDTDGGLVICDAQKGLLRLDSQGELHTLVDTFDGERLRFVNNAAVASDGTIYFTDTSRRFGIQQFRYDILEHSGTGRLLQYRPDGRIRVLLDNLQFANGVALDAAEQFVLVAETAAYAIQRLWLKGDRAGEREVFVENLPGFPDNLSRYEETFWIAIPSLRDPLLDAMLPYPWMRRLFAYLPDAFHSRVRRYGFALGLDASGRVVYNLQDSTGRVAVVTGVRQHGNRLFLGSLQDSAITVCDLAELRKP